MAARVQHPSSLYPSVEPYRRGFLLVGGGHRIYFEETGNRNGKPAVFLHGGPGAGTEPKMRRFFDPRKYRIVLFDQRGCGRSRPLGSLIDNTTWHLIADIEALRTHLGIQRWLVFGGSWGSTLALAYAEKHPERVSELVLRGIFLGRRCDIAWMYQSSTGLAALYPDQWEKYIAPIPNKERRDMMRAYYRRLTGDNAKTLIRAARAWALWEGATSYLLPNAGEIALASGASFARALARIGCHYFFHRCFFRRDGQLLDEVSRVRKIPAVIPRSLRCYLSDAQRLGSAPRLA